MKGTQTSEGQGSGVRGQVRAAITAGLVVAAVAVLLAGAGTLTALATQGTLRVDSGGAFVGGDVSVGVHANVGEPGLGAWTVDVAYDNSVVSPIDCMGPSAYTVCSTTYGPETVLATGAHPTGLIGDLSLATFSFRCERVATSQLSISVRVFADATPANPHDIDETVQNGTITCAESTPRSGTLTIDSATMHVGEAARILVHGRNMPIDPGLGTWTFSVSYEAAVAQAGECVPRALPSGDSGNNTCDVVFDAGAVVVRGTSTLGLPPDYDFAEIIVWCNRSGESRLTASAAGWAIRTVELQDLPLPGAAEGSITCLERQTSSPPKPPPAGSMAASNSTPCWPLAPIAALTAFGLAALAAAALAARRRRA